MNIGDCSFERGFCNWKNWKNDEEDQFDWMIGEAVVKLNSSKRHHQSSNLTTGKNSNKNAYCLTSVPYSYVRTDWPKVNERLAG